MFITLYKVLAFDASSVISCFCACYNSYVFVFFPVEVLLDMKASGGELGWLTLPNENGVSIYTSTGIFKASGSGLETASLCARKQLNKRQLKNS